MWRAREARGRFSPSMQHARARLRPILIMGAEKCAPKGKGRKMSCSNAMGCFELPDIKDQRAHARDAAVGGAAQARGSRPPARQSSSGEVNGAPLHRAGHPGHAVPRYLPSTVPRKTTTGKSIRWTARGMTKASWVFRCRYRTCAIWNNGGRPGGPALSTSNRAWRNRSKSIAGLVIPRSTTASSPSFHQRCALPLRKSAEPPASTNKYLPSTEPESVPEITSPCSSSPK